jgi:hypothetical protein
VVHTNLSVGMTIEGVEKVVEGCLSNRFLHLCRGCRLVVGRSGRMGEEGVYDVRIVSGVAFLSATLPYTKR